MSPTIQQVLADVNLQDWQGANQLIDQVIADHPNSALAWYYKAQILQHTGDLSGAKGALNSALAIDPNHTFAGNPIVYQHLVDSVSGIGVPVAHAVITHPLVQQVPVEVVHHGGFGVAAAFLICALFTMVAILILLVSRAKAERERELEEVHAARRQVIVDRLNAAREREEA